MGEYLDRWLEGSVKDSLKPSTYDGYSDLARRHVIPAFRRTKLKDLTTDQIRNFRRFKLDDGLSRRTVQYLLFLLRKALQQAVEDGHIPRNVAHGVKVTRSDKEEIRPLSVEEAKEFLEAVSGNRFEALYVLAVTKGLRLGELLSLKWEDVDLKAKTLSVRRTLSEAEGGHPVFSTPKTAKSRRPVPLTRRAVEALERHRIAQDEERAKLKTFWHNTGLEFRSTTSTPVNRHNLINCSFKPLLREAGVRDIRFHDLRHTCATLLLSKGKHPKFVQELLGHATVSITSATYSHVLPGMDDGLAKAMDDGLS